MNERELLKVFGVNIKQYRALSRWSQAELAEKADISINFLSDIETGKKWASPTTMVKFAMIFGIEAYELLKPCGLLPDRVDSAIKKYTEEVLAAVNSVRDQYLEQSRLPR
ncbi:MAG: helix-turn-helix domain-containing protein [Treponema sp.]|jgi:transcriptional regulator with XRE-family HTH domain|nr:helix-turn-helix domain-containing protein [Treponema sp.]